MKTQKLRQEELFAFLIHNQIKLLQVLSDSLNPISILNAILMDNSRDYLKVSMDSTFINLETFLKDARQLDHITIHTSRHMVDQLLQLDMLVISEMLKLEKMVLLYTIKKIHK